MSAHPSLLARIAEFLSPLIGRFRWQPPAWVGALAHSGDQLGRSIARHPRGFVIALMLIAAGVAVINRPQPVPPHQVTCELHAPELTDYRHEGGKKVSPLRFTCGASVAPVALAGQVVPMAPVALSPELPGEWRWLNDRELQFTPSDDWPVGQDFSLRIDPKVALAPSTVLTATQYGFRSADFSASWQALELYQDPVDPGLKKLVGTLRFTHPVAADALEGKLALALGPGLGQRDPKAPAVTISVDADGIEAHVHSAPLTVPRESVGASLELQPGVQALRGGPRLTQSLAQSVTVPGRYQLVLSAQGISHARAASGESEQVLLLESNFPLRDEAIRDQVKLWVLPPRETWPNGDIDEDLLADAEALVLQHIPSDNPENRLHAFKLKAPVNAEVYLQVAAGIESIGGYLAREKLTRFLNVPPYPQALKLMGTGAVLSLSGERKIGLMAQGLPGVRIEIARFLPAQLHHLVDQNSGRFAAPEVYGESLDRLVERQRIDLPLPNADPAKPVYDHIDLAPYLDAGPPRRGVFLLTLAPFDPAHPENTPVIDWSDESSVSDRRVVLVTDLGILAKRSLDGSQDVFVQSINSGLPVAGAKVAVVGRNGLAVAETETDAEGRAHFPNLGELQRERTPIMLVVEKDADLSFLPLQKWEHGLELSRFDIGGTSDELEPGTLEAFAFTDRGLYRPGETAHIAWVVRTQDWRGDLAGVPLEIEVSDARGAIVESVYRSLPASGFDTLDVSTQATSPSGSYTVQVYVINARKERERWLGSTSFIVREFEPDRLKVRLGLHAPSVKGWVKPAEVKAQVEAKHLFGAPASERVVTGNMRLFPALPSFSQYPDFRFHVDDGLKESVSEALADSITNAEGEATLNLDLSRFATNTYRLVVDTRVLEAGSGRGVAAEAETLVADRDFLVGVKTPDPLDYVRQGEPREVRWLVLGPDLAPRPSPALNLSLVEHRFVSVLVRQSNGTYKYESRKKDIIRSTEAVTLSAGENAQTLPTTEPGDFSWVLTDTDGAELNRVTWTVAGEGNLSRSLERNAELQLKLDKPRYAPGEDIEIAIRAPYTGAGLITIERDRVYHHQWFRSDTTSSVQRIRLPEGIEGNAYVSVQFVRDPASPEVYTSPLSYAVVPFAISLAHRELTVSLQTPALVRPGTQLPIQVQASEPTDAVIYAVDEGILQVAGYRTPQPLEYFFRKRSLGVGTLQILSLLMPEFSLLMHAQAPGGDAEAALASNLNPFARKRRGPVAWWSGVVHIPSEGLSLEYPVPDSFNGRLRIMAVAVQPERIGVSETHSEVRGPWVLTPNVPAMVSPGDRFTVSVGAFSNLATPQDLTLTLATGPGLKVLNPTTAPITVTPSSEATARFTLEATEHLGSSDITAIASSADSEGPVQLSETTSVRPAQVYRVNVQAGLTRDRISTHTFKRDLYPELSKRVIGVADGPLVWASGLSAWLADYTHQCTEQLISKALPDLVWGSEQGRLPQTPESILQALRILRERQNSEGGFGLWAASPVVEPRVSLHAADFLFEAEARGVTLPQGLRADTLRYLQQLASQAAEGLSGLRDRAQAAYLLTRQGEVTSNALADIASQLQTYHQDTWALDIAAGYLAASHQLLQQTGLAGKLIDALPWRVITPSVAANDDPYYDALVHDAEHITLIARHFPERLRKIPDGVLSALGEQLNAERFTTLSAALLVRAFDLFSVGQANSAESIQVRARAAGGEWQALAQAGRPPRADVPLPLRDIEVEQSTAAGRAFHVQTEAGFDRTLAEQPAFQGLEVFREFLDQDNQPIQQVKVGEEFRVRLRFRATNPGLYSQIAITDLLPGGVEVVRNAAATEPDSDTATADEAMAAEDGAEVTDASGNDTPVTGRPAWQAPFGEPANNGWQAEFAEVREDRVVLYGSLSHDLAEFTYRLRASNEGEFTIPPPYVEAMYDRSLYARGASGKRFTILARDPTSSASTPP